MRAVRLLRRLGTALLVALTVAVVFAALVASVGRYYLANIDAYRPYLFEVLEQRTGLRLAAGALAGDWHGLTPELAARELVVLHPVSGDPVLRMDRIGLRVDLLGSLAAAAPRIRLVTAAGVDIELEEVALGRWYLRGFSGEGEGDAGAALDLVLGIYRARLEQVQLQLQFAAGHTSTVQADQIRLSRAGDFRRFRAGLQLSANQPVIDLVVESLGDPRHADDFRASGYASFMGIDLSPVLPLLEPLGVKLEEGLVDGELWLQWLGEREFIAQGQLSIPSLDLAGLSGRRLEPVTDLALRLRLQAGREDWRLWLPSLRGRWAGQSLELDRLTLQRRADGSLELALPRLALAPLMAALSGSGLLDADQQALLASLAPEGELVRLHVERSATGESTVRAELEDVGIAPWHGAPGASGVDGYLELGLDGGAAVLASRDLQLEFPDIYNQPLRIDRLEAALRWTLDDERVRVHSGPITAGAQLGEVAGHLSLDLPLAPSADQPPQMTLVLGLRDSHSRYRDRLIPTVLDESLLDWLERAIGPAEVPLGGFIYRGSLRHGDIAGRTVQLMLEVRDGELDYHPPWPALRDIDGRVLIDDGETAVDAVAARALSRTRIKDARFGFDPATGRLAGRAGLQSADEDLLQLFTTTPLRDTVGGVFDHWRWTGPVSAELELDLPLGEGDPAEVAVAATLGPGRLELGEVGLTVTDLRGPVEYRSDAGRIGLHSSGLQGRLFGEPVAARLDPSDGPLRIALDIPTLSIADLQDWLRLPIPLEHLAEGETAVEALIEVDRDGAGLRAHSDLGGVAIALPEPWGKTADHTTPLRLSMALPDGPMELTIGDDFRLGWEGGDTAGGAVAVGATTLPALIPGRIRIAGALRELDLGEWRGVLDRLEPGMNDRAGGAEDGAMLPIDIAGLEIARVPLLGQPFSGVTVSGGSGPEGWRLQLRADQLAGEMVLPSPSGAPLGIWLGWLDLTTDPSGDSASVAGEGTGRTAVASLDPRQVPELEFAVGALRVDGELLGGLRFDLRPLEDGLRLDRLGGNLRGVSITGGPGAPGGRLDWRQDAEGIYSEFQGQLLAGDLAGVLAEFGYEPALISERAVLDSRLRWRGRPDQLSLTGISGEATLLVEQGRFSKVSDSASGALKAMGIFNLANLTRRLRLDFSDIFSSGVSFNRLEGQFRLDRGVVETLEPLRIDSPSSRFVASGQVDFNTDLVEMELIATLPIASSLPWVAALAGGLPAAAGVYIVGKLFEEQMDRYSSVMYRIDGNWTDPRVEFVRIFDDGGAGDGAASASAGIEAGQE